MKKRSNFIWMLAATTLAMTACQSNAGTGALVGGGVGAGTGAIVAGGHGALIGGAVGVAGGALIGHMLDANERSRIEQNNPRTLQHIDHGEQLTVNDIITLHKSGISDKKIMELIQKTDSKYRLSTETIHRLERAGVSDKVINYMQSRQ